MSATAWIAPRIAVRKAVHPVAEAILIVAVLLAATRAGTYFLVLPYASLAWPPTGVALAILLLGGLRVWPAVTIGTTVSDIWLLDLAPASVPFVVLAGVLYPAVAAIMLCRYFGFRTSMDRVRDVLALLLVATVVGAATATISVGGSRWVGDGAPMSFWGAWVTWLAGGMMGIIVFSPLILTWAQRTPFDLRPRRMLEALIVYASLVVASLADFCGVLWRAGGGPTLYLIFPFVIWAALRFGPRGSALAHLIASCIAILATVNGLGPFIRDTLFKSLIDLHSFTLVIVMTSLLLAATTAEREHSRAIAEHSARQLTSVVSSISDGILVADAEEHLVLANPAQSKLVGMEETLTSLLRQSLQGETLADVRRTLRDTRSGRDLFVDISSAPILDAGRVVGAVSVSRNVTERVEIERMLDEFFTVAAHELKTPLTVQKAAVQSLARLRPWDAAARSRIDSIERGADRMNRVVEDMLDVSQLAAGSLRVRVETVDLSHLIQAYVDEFAKRSPGHAFVVTAPDSLMVEADAFRIEQVLRNLLDNAAKYSPTASAVEIAVAAEAGSAVVTVRDYGIGIPTGREGRVFERFYRAHEGTPHEHCGGLGIGLYLSRSIIERLGGTMSFVSEPGRGSAFSFRLPLTPG